MMKRRVIQLGTKTLLVSLPSKWAREHGVKKGDELSLEVQGKDIVVKGGALKSPPVEVDISGFDSSLVWYSMISLYRKGIDDVTVRFTESKLWDRRALKNVLIQDLLHSVAEQLMGWAVVKTSSDSIRIRDLSAPNPDELSHSVIRAYQTVLTFAEDLTDAIGRNDAEVIDTLAERADRQVNRLVNFSIRLLSKYQPANLSIHHVLVNLEGIGDTLADIAKAARTGWERNDLLTGSVALLRAGYELFLKPSRERLLALEECKLALDSELEGAEPFSASLVRQLKKFVMESAASYA